MLPGLQIHIRNQANRVLNSEVGVPAILHWREVTDLPENFDRNDEDTHTGTVLNRTLPFRVLFHQIDHRASGYQRFMEVQTGDVYLDYLAELTLADKQDPRIEVNGTFYVQKVASKKLLEYFDAQMFSGGIFKTLFLTPAQ